MSWAVTARSASTAVATSGAGIASASAAGSDSSVSIDAGSEPVSVKPSPLESVASSSALMRSVSESTATDRRGSERPPPGITSSVSSAKSKARRASLRWPC